MNEDILSYHAAASKMVSDSVFPHGLDAINEQLYAQPQHCVSVDDTDLQDVAHDTVGRQLDEQELALARHHVQTCLEWREIARLAVRAAVDDPQLR